MFNTTYAKDEAMKNAMVHPFISSYFDDPKIYHFFKNLKMLGRMGKFLFKQYLEKETYEIELIVKFAAMR